MKIIITYVIMVLVAAQGLYAEAGIESKPLSNRWNSLPGPFTNKWSSPTSATQTAFAPCAVVKAMNVGECEAVIQELVTAFLKEGGNVNALCQDAMNQNDDTLLMLAVKQQYPGVVDTLLTAKANPNAQDSTGQTPLMMAAATCQNTVTRKLLAAGANPTMVNKYGKTAYDIAKMQNANMCLVPENRKSERACALKEVVSTLQSLQK